MNKAVFISYASEDKAVADMVCKALEKDGIGCWIAPRDVPPGVEYADAIIDALNACRVFLVILSEESNSSSQVRREVERAVSKDLDVLTFRIDNTLLSKAMEYYLSDRHWLDASNAVLAKQLHILSEAVHKLLERTPLQEEEAAIPMPGESKEAVELRRTALVEGKGKAKRGSHQVQRSIAVAKPGMRGRRNLILGIITTFVILGGIGALFWFRRYQFPAVSGLLANISPTVETTFTSTITSTSTRPPTITPRPTLTTTPVPAWITEFVEPILKEISSRPPDIEDQFEQRSSTFIVPDWCSNQDVNFENGKMLITGCRVKNQYVTFNDYMVEFTASFIEGQGRINILFRDGACTFIIQRDGYINAACSKIQNGQITTTEVEKQFTYFPLDKTIQLRLIAKGDRFAFYVDGVPVGYFKVEALKYGSELELGPGGGNTTAAFDDFKAWDITDLQIP